MGLSLVREEGEPGIAVPSSGPSPPHTHKNAYLCQYAPPHLRQSRNRMSRARRRRNLLVRQNVADPSRTFPCLLV